ncbi:AcrR family transcriptional regulator [Arthrobacter sp. V1I7]|uniref:TetR/AcrR family transcriptional regulator n=1 Tax=Arthrobacter sp. V1I7 TaxID=3042274 RepID=UPI0027856D13|nr:TetR/AcrR family transcriptional regulator [Arthrobacter sp. V1I7]MDQ0823792.1 AcrR family transcriptional regulator [Arthrobacter sp. V1I7]
MSSGIGRRRRAAQMGTSNVSYHERRQQIFEAAGHVFKKQGFRGTSLSDIADFMNTDRANLYYYVGSKVELLDGVVSDPVRANLERAREIRDSDLGTKEKLRTLMVELMESYERHYPFLYVYIQENLSQMQGRDATWARSMRDINREYERIVVQTVEDGMKEGVFRSNAPASVIAYGIFGLLAWTSRWFDPKNAPASAQAVGVAYADLVLDGLVVRN